MRNLRSTVYLLLGLSSLLLAPGAWANVTKVICVPWQGDITKYHTTLQQAACPDATGIVPASVTFEVIATCSGNVVLQFQLNGNNVASLTTSGGCTCTPPVDNASVSAADLTSFWNPGGNNTLRVLLMSGAEDFAIVRAKIDYGNGFPVRTICLYNYNGGDCNENNLCTAGYIYLSSLDESATFGNTYCPAGGPPAAILKGVIKTTGTASVYYKWVYGDGTESGINTLSGSTRYDVEDTHQYTGAVGTPFTAMLQVSDASDLSGAISDSYLVKLEANTLDSRINVAIDTGLWYLHKNGTRSDGVAGSYLTYNGMPCMVWSYNGYYSSPTASAVQSFEINGSKETGNFDEDPYAEDAHLGLNWLLQGHVGGTLMLQAVNISPDSGHPSDNPDSNANGIGIQTPSGRPIYEGGMIMDALIASGTPNASSGRDFLGTGHLHTYGEIIQDMADMYAFGQFDTSYGFNTWTGSPGSATANSVNGIIGGWRYSWQDFPDNSACQWAAIGMIPAQQAPFNATVPGWVKNYDDNWLWYSFDLFDSQTHGGFGYTGSGSGEATTPSGMVQLAFDGKTTSDFRWVTCEAWLSDTWSSWLTSAQQNLYAMYAFTKAMRLAQPSPVVNLSQGSNAGLDWYRGSSTVNGVAPVLSDYLLANNHYPDPAWGGDMLGTAWSVIMLKPTLFAAGPIACFTAHPNPGFSGLPIKFDPSCSSHSDPTKSIKNLTKFEWSWGDGSPDTITTTPDVVDHAFTCNTLPCTFHVKLTVTDDNNPPLTATFQMDIRITNPPHPPVSNPDGPYWVSLCSGDTLTLDGSASFSPDEGLHETGCATCPNDTITAWDWALKGAPFVYTDAHGETVALGSGFTTFFPSAGSYDIGLQVTDNAKAAYPSSGTDNLTDQAFTQVIVYNSGPCNVTATPGCQSVALKWNDVGASQYDVYRSIKGPNSGFVLVGMTSTLTLTDNTVAFGTPYWYRVLAHIGNGVSASGPVKVTDTFDDCLCITGLRIYPKNLLVELDWTAVQGASSYNVYRSLAPNVALVAGNLVATGVGTQYPVWVDNHVVNGKTYYYKLTEVVNGVEVCISAEVSGTPIAPRR